MVYPKCLVHIWPAMDLRSPYPARIPLSVRPPRGLPAEAGGGCEIFVRIHGLRGLYDLVWREVLQIWKNHKTVARRHVVGGIAQSPYGHHAKADPRTGSVRFQFGGCGDWTATAVTALTLHDFRITSAQSLYRFTPGCPRVPRRRKCTMPVDNVNTYAVARSHLRCPKNRTENPRQIIARRPGANVN